MEQDNYATWLADVVQLRDGYDVEAVKRFSDRLLRLASSRLPNRLRQRVDPEDIVQSVFRSFFARHEAGQYEFGEAPDVWRLLAAITYHKVQRTIRHHGRQQRDVKREVHSDDNRYAALDAAPTVLSVAMMMELLDQILDELPESHREIVRLRMENYSIAEIAERAKVSTRTVLRALKLVRKVASEISDQP